MCLSVILTWACGHVAVNALVRCDAYYRGQCQGIVQQQNPGGSVAHDCPICQTNAGAPMATEFPMHGLPFNANEPFLGAAQMPIPSFHHPATAPGTGEESSLGGGTGLPYVDVVSRAGAGIDDTVRTKNDPTWSQAVNPLYSTSTRAASEEPVDILAAHGFVDHEGEYGELWTEPKGKAAVRNPPATIVPPERWDSLNHPTQANPTYASLPPQHPYENYGPAPVAHPYPFAYPPPPAVPSSVAGDFNVWQSMPPIGMGHGYNHGEGATSRVQPGQGFVGAEDQGTSGFRYTEEGTGKWD